MNRLPRTVDRTTRYDAFISHSHAADAELAGALRAGLQRFATSWSPFSWLNPVRSLRVFRDASALSADPALWSAIERALAASDWLILLASVQGAQSPWIDKEVTFWCANKPKERILLVLTDGELAWDDDASDFDWRVTTALSRRFAGIFAQEPLWLDLRWAKTSGRPSLRDPRFHDAVASIASPLRGIPKDDLIGEDIRQHQRLQRWRNVAMVTLLVLLVCAVLAAEIARRQRNLALAREAEAIAERARAERQAEIALARQLAAQSVQLRLQSVDRIELSLLLAVESMRRDKAFEGVQALVQALALTPERSSDFHHRYGVLQQDAVWVVAFSPDGRRLASASEDGSMALWQVGGEQIWHHAISAAPVRALAFRPDGKTLATGSQDGTAFEQRGKFDVWRTADGKVVAQGRGRALPLDDYALNDRQDLLAIAYRDKGTVEIWNIVQARQVGEIPLSSRAFDLSLSPLGDRLAIVLGQRPEGKQRYAPLDYRIEVRDLFDGRRVVELPLGDLQPVRVFFLPDGQRLVVVTGDWQFPSGIHVLDTAKPGERVSLHDTLEMGALRLAPDGQHLAAISRSRARVWDLHSGRAVAELPTTGYLRDIGFSPDGRYLVTASDDHDATFWLWRADDLLEQACGRLTRNLSRREWQDFLPYADYHPTCSNLPIDDDQRVVE